MGAMTELGNGLFAAKHYEDSLPVREAELAMNRRFGHGEEAILAAQGNLASTHQQLRRYEEANCLRRDVYSAYLRLHGEEHVRTVTGANNYANSLVMLKRFEEARSLTRKMIPVARRVLGESHDIPLKMRKMYAEATYFDAGATLDDLREAVAMLEEIERTARRVLGGAHPLVRSLEGSMRLSREAHRAREASNA